MIGSAWSKVGKIELTLRGGALPAILGATTLSITTHSIATFSMIINKT
jgi:hypothetical protein